MLLFAGHALFAGQACQVSFPWYVCSPCTSGFVPNRSSENGVKQGVGGVGRIRCTAQGCLSLVHVHFVPDPLFLCCCSVLGSPGVPLQINFCHGQGCVWALVMSFLAWQSLWSSSIGCTWSKFKPFCKLDWTVAHTTSSQPKHYTHTIYKCEYYIYNSTDKYKIVLMSKRKYVFGIALLYRDVSQDLEKKKEGFRG
jgi:hypothetical protein